MSADRDCQAAALTRGSLGASALDYGCALRGVCGFQEDDSTTGEQVRCPRGRWRTVPGFRGKLPSLEVCCGSLEVALRVLPDELLLQIAAQLTEAEDVLAFAIVVRSGSSTFIASVGWEVGELQQAMDSVRLQTVMERVLRRIKPFQPVAQTRAEWFQAALQIQLHKTASSIVNKNIATVDGWMLRSPLAFRAGRDGSEHSASLPPFGLPPAASLHVPNQG